MSIIFCETVAFLRRICCFSMVTGINVLMACYSLLVTLIGTILTPSTPMPQLTHCSSCPTLPCQIPLLHLYPFVRFSMTSVCRFFWDVYTVCLLGLLAGLPSTQPTIICPPF